jgi:hypothetical protein
MTYDNQVRVVVAKNYSEKLVIVRQSFIRIYMKFEEMVVVISMKNLLKHKERMSKCILYVYSPIFFWSNFVVSTHHSSNDVVPLLLRFLDRLVLNMGTRKLENHQPWMEKYNAIRMGKKFVFLSY